MISICHFGTVGSFVLPPACTHSSWNGWQQNGESPVVFFLQKHRLGRPENYLFSSSKNYRSASKYQVYRRLIVLWGILSASKLSRFYTNDVTFSIRSNTCPTISAAGGPKHTQVCFRCTANMYSEKRLRMQIIHLSKFYNRFWMLYMAVHGLDVCLSTCVHRDTRQGTFHFWGALDIWATRAVKKCF